MRSHFGVDLILAFFSARHSNVDPAQRFRGLICGYRRERTAGRGDMHCSQSFPWANIDDI